MHPNRIGIRIFAALLIGVAFWLAGEGAAVAQSTESAEPTSATLEAKQIAQWRAFHKQFVERLDAYMRNGDRDADLKNHDALLSIDPSAVAPEFRYVFYSDLLALRQVHGEWPEMLRIRDSLMRPRNGPKDGLEDADLLCTIASYFVSSVYDPPQDYPLANDPSERAAQKLHYWESHYLDPKEGARIYQYIVDNFDPLYSTVPEALALLAACQNLDGEFEASLENYKKFANIDLTKLYSIRRFNGGRMLLADERLASDVPFLKSGQGSRQLVMVRTAERLEPARAQSELDEIEQSHPIDPRVLEEIGSWRIRQASKQDDPAGSIDRLEKIRMNYPDSDRVQEAAEDLIFRAQVGLAQKAGTQPPAMSRAMLGRNRIEAAYRADDPEGSIQRLAPLKSEYSDIPRLQRRIDFYLKAAHQALPAARQESESTTASTATNQAPAP